MFFSLVLVGLITLLVYLYWRRTTTRAPLPAGPPGWLVVGNTLQLDPLHPHLTLAEWAREYGDVYTISVNGSRIVVVNGADAVYEMMVTKSKQFAGRYAQYY